MTTAATRTPTDLRAVTVRDYRRDAERLGLVVDLAAIERQALADCEVYDAVTRDATPRAPAPPDPVKEAEKAGELDRLAAEAGTSILREPVAKQRPTIFNTVPKPLSRLSMALGRIAVICRGSAPGKTRREALATCECPDLAWEFMRLYAFYMTRGYPPQPGVEANPFYGVSEKYDARWGMSDLERRYLRRLEDICDKSTGRLGPWRVPK